uniref:C-C motif chemokine n=1 Tax=Oryzias melastigma TaxID=30732 RepID=A0A3B3DVH9_ORYME
MTQMMMKASVAVVTLFLLFSSVAVLASELCCTRFNTDKIPENTVTGFKSSSKECDERGVIFERNSDPDICVDPSLEWVKKIIIGFQ